MNTRRTDRNQSATVDSVVSQDGTAIGYRRLGHGPGLIYLHGALESSGSHTQLAEILASEFTVYLPDRRGRGFSGPFGEHYSLQSEIDDLQAILAQTQAHYVTGSSSGAIIGLWAALKLPAIHALAAWEPPLSINDSFPTTWLTEYDREVAEGDLAEAMVIGTKAAQMFGHTVPHWLLKRASQLMIGNPNKPATGDGVALRNLIPTFRRDAQLAEETANKWEELTSVKIDVLLMGGGKSPDYLKTALHTLEATLPHAKRAEFPSLNHGGPNNKNRGGRPNLIAGELQKFFSSSPRHGVSSQTAR